MSAVLKPSTRLPSLEAVRLHRARTSLLQFTLRTKPDYLPGWFHAEVAAELDRFLLDVEAKRGPRLMLFAPPQHGKTELVSRRLPAYAFGRWPDLRIIAASYSSDLASRNNRDVQRIMDCPEYLEVFPETRLFGKNVRTVAQGSWLRNNDIFEVVGRRGSYRSAGVEGGISGMSADILIIDDPVKGPEDAFSQTMRNSLWEWYLLAGRARVQSGGGVLLIMTRWHEDDLAGRILESARAAGERERERWRVVSYPALAEADEPHRKAGEALAPRRYTAADLAVTLAEVGPTRFASLYQQRPSAAEGNIFKRGFAQLVPRRLVKAQRTVISWDTAFGKKSDAGDFSVSLGMQLFERGVFVFDRRRGRWSLAALREASYAQAGAVADEHGLEAVLIEDKASGQSLVQEMRADTRLPVKPMQPEGDKIVRANVCVPYWESKRVFFPMDEATGAPEPWVDEFLEMLYTFPNGRFKDDVDAFTQGLRFLVLGGNGAGFIEWVYQQVGAQKAARKAEAEQEDKLHPIEYVEYGGATSERRH